MSVSRRVLAVVSVVLAAVCVAGCAPQVPPPAGFPAGTRHEVIVYGDSLTAEASKVISAKVAAQLPGWSVRVRAFGGTAQCDWHDEMRAETSAASRPAVVVIAFSGNDFTPCMRARGASGSRATPGSYRADALWAAELWRSAGGTRVVFVGTPPRASTVAAPNVPSSNPVTEQYREVAGLRGVRFADMAPWFTDPVSGRAEVRVPCLVGEVSGCTNGRVQVRNSVDGVHLCDDHLPGDACAGYSSGAERFADVVVASAADAAKLRFSPRRLAAVAQPPPFEPDVAVEGL